MSLQTSLTRRRGTYYFRLRVPRDLAGEISREELRLSLRTAHPDEARARGARCLAQARALFDALRQSPMLTTEEKIALVRRFYELALEEDQQTRRRAAGDLGARRRLARRIKQRPDGGQDRSRAAALGSADTTGRVDWQ